MQPLGSRVTLRVPKAPEKIGSLWLPPEAQKEYTIAQGEVVAVGKDVADKRIQPGLRVLTRRFGSFKHEDDEGLWTCYERDILAIVDVGELES